MSRFMKLFPSVNQNWQNENKIYFNDVARDLVRCLECRNIILKSEIFNCDECDSANLNNRRVLCQYCGVNNHCHPKSTAAAAAFGAANGNEIGLEENATKGGDRDKNVTVDSGNHSSGSVGADLFDLKNQVNNVFDFIRGGLADLMRENIELEKRRADMEKKKDQFRSILNRFETDVRAVMSNEKRAPINDQMPRQQFVNDQMSRQEYANDQNPNDQSFLSTVDDHGSFTDDFQIVPIERQIFVGGLPSRVRQAELKQVFSGYGPVTGVKILSKIAGKNACAFVAFESADAAREALRSPPPFSQFWHGNRTRRLYVEAKCSTSMVNLPDSFKIRVTNLPTGVRLLELKQFFEKHGKVLGSKLRFRRGEPWRVGCAYVAFDSKETAERVAALKALNFGKNGRPIYVHLAENKNGEQ